LSRTFTEGFKVFLRNWNVRSKATSARYW